MKRKVTAVLAALLVMAMGTTTAFAANSPSVPEISKPAEGQTAGTTVSGTKTPSDYAGATTAEGATVSAVAETTVKSVANTVQNLLNNLASVGLGDVAKDSSKNVVADVKTVVELTADQNTQQLFARGQAAELKIGVAGINAGSKIVILHWDGTKWEQINPTEVGNGYVKGMFKSLSPVAVVELAVQNAAAPAQGYSPEWYEAQKTRYTVQNAVATAGGSAAVTSPKTGETASVLPILALASLAGVVVCTRKVKFN